MEFWTASQMASIHKMLNPRSIAIVGATPRMQYGGRMLAAALKAQWPKLALQRCTNHKLWNLLAKAPAHLREELVRIIDA